ncbi:hypothetical protein SLE2022_353050 [Rubroshorea leprosula]
MLAYPFYTNSLIFMVGKSLHGHARIVQVGLRKFLAWRLLPDYISQNLTSSSDYCTKEQYSSISSSLTFLLDRANDISRTEMMKFLCNAILLGLTAFPCNYILEEAALIVEELFVTKMNSSSCSVAPCQSLAKRLLKGDRQVGVSLHIVRSLAICYFILLKTMICLWFMELLNSCINAVMGLG